MSYEYDVLVLGGGPGGYEAAIRCAQYGLKTCLVEAEQLGGTCLNRGCIPTKALLHGAEVFSTCRTAQIFGVETDGVRINYEKLAQYRDSRVNMLRHGVERLERAHGVAVVKGFGTLSDAHTVKTGERSISARNIILATGSKPGLPPLLGIEGKAVVTSDDVLQMHELPRSLLIVGGGVIGVEFAMLFSQLDVPTTILELTDTLLPGMDEEISGTMRALLEKRGVKVETGACVQRFEKNRAIYTCFGESKVCEAEWIVVCTGRRPQTGGIGLEALGVRMNRGYVETDAMMRTNIPHIYAIGDITGKQQLAHTASAQGAVAAAACAGKPHVAIRYDRIPACVYTLPEIACIGMTQAQAEEKGCDVKIGRFAAAGNGRSLTMNETEGFVKLISDAKTGEILGCQMLAPHATDIIAEIAAVMNCEGTVDELAATVHPHPTISEMLMEAAHDTEGLSCNAMPRK